MFAIVVIYLTFCVLVYITIKLAVLKADHKEVWYIKDFLLCSFISCLPILNSIFFLAALYDLGFFKSIGIYFDKFMSMRSYI